MLPLGPPDRYGSPYKARSAFAAWPGLPKEIRMPSKLQSDSTEWIISYGNKLP